LLCKSLLSSKYYNFSREARFESFIQISHHPSDRLETGKIVVKTINYYGDELPKVYLILVSKFAVFRIGICGYN